MNWLAAEPGLIAAGAFLAALASASAGFGFAIIGTGIWIQPLLPPEGGKA